MGAVETLWKLNIAELFGLGEAGIDDADTDADCSLYASDGVNGTVYKIASDRTFDAFPVARTRSTDDGQPVLKIAVAADSSFCVADAGSGSIVRHNELGESVGELPAPGVISLCRGPEGLICALSSFEGSDQIVIYDQIGTPVMALSAPGRRRARLDPSIANLDCDRAGNVYVSYGMPPYRIWKVSPYGAEMQTWKRKLSYPEDAVLIADIAVDSEAGVLWALLARRESGRQVLDAWSLDGDLLGGSLIPHSSSLFGVICAAGGSELFLLDTSSGPGAGDVVRVSVSP